MTIDAHQHFWKYHPQRDAWITEDMQVLRRDFTPEDLLPILVQNGIDGCVAVQADQSEDETNFLLACANQHAFIQGVVGWIDFRDPALEKRLDYVKQFEKLKGFRHIVQAEPAGFLSDGNFRRGVALAASHGFTYDLLILHHQFPDALPFIHSLPDVPIVIDHIGKPSIKTKEKTHWELNLAAASSFQNVYCKLSGLVTEAEWNQWTRDDFFPFLDEVFECFGTDRVMYGSDWPVCLLSASYEQQLSIVNDYLQELSAEERAKVMGGNAIRFYKL